MALLAGESKGRRSSGEAAGASRFGSSGPRTTSSGKYGPVYMGPTSSGAGRVSAYAPTGATGQRRVGVRTLSKEEAEQDIYTWSSKKQMDFMAKAALAGLVKFGDGPMEASKLWKDLVKEASFYGKSGAKISPMDILDMYVQGNNGGKGVWSKQGDFEVNSMTGERRYVGPRFKTTTASRVDLTDPATARAIATRMFQDLMMRNPGKGEIGAFATALAQAEQDSPVTETTTTEYDMTTGEPIGTKTASSGGLTADARAMIAEDRIKADPEYGAVQAATTYMNAFENAIYGAPE